MDRKETIWVVNYSSSNRSIYLIQFLVNNINDSKGCKVREYCCSYWKNPESGWLDIDSIEREIRGDVRFESFEGAKIYALGLLYREISLITTEMEALDKIEDPSFDDLECR